MARTASLAAIWTGPHARWFRLATGRIGLGALLLSAASPTACAEALVAARAQRVEPVVLMRDGTLEGCGLTAHFDTAGNTIAIELVARRHAGGIEHVLSGRWQTAAGKAVVATDIALRTDRIDTRAHFLPPTTDTSGTVVALGRLDPVAGALFIQGVMVAGGGLTLQSADGATLDLELAGPLPQLVRASYLNCSGDLYRP
ncbi:MAG: hypothetical protein NW217_03370 [Hyphomicrobiaceae bacterium]|nr:hypothetical protein [Hyphomicrobiaceae bacterium]